jgi:hypothetical protein
MELRGLWQDWRAGQSHSWLLQYSSKFSLHLDFSNEPTYFQFEPEELKFYLKRCIFLVRVLVKARFLDFKATDPKPQYLEKNIVFLSLCLKFQLSRCRNDEKK